MKKESKWSCHGPISLEAENVRGTFLKYFWAKYARNELDWCSRYHTNMVFCNAVAVMDKIGEWEKNKEDEHPIAARFGACMLIYTKAVLSARPEDVNNFIHTLYWITGAISKSWEVLY